MGCRFPKNERRNMKPNHKIEPSMLDNAHLFDNNFFRRFVLRHAPQPLKLTDNIAKNYLFPTFYGDVTCAQVTSP